MDDKEDRQTLMDEKEERTEDQYTEGLGLTTKDSHIPNNLGKLSPHDIHSYTNGAPKDRSRTKSCVRLCALTLVIKNRYLLR